MSDTAPPISPRNFEIAVICALQEEATAVEYCFDVSWPDVQYTKATRDQNTYTVGRMGKHAVVLAWMPGTGKANSASVAANCHSTFTGLKLCLIVGVCGGVPTSNEPLLGDVVISTQVVQYDYGSRLPNKVAIKNTLEESLPPPNREIRSYLIKMRSPKGRKGLEETTTNYLQEILNQEDMGDCKYPGVDKDRLFGPTDRHKHYRGDYCICTRCKNEGDEVCDDALKSKCVDLGCKPVEPVLRPRWQGIQQRREEPKPRIHFGRVASGDLVMKSAQHRDQLALEENVIAFEMESAGVWETLPTIVIKGICDYADSHKGYEWHGYAAAAAAACMKAFLRGWWPIVAQPGHLENLPMSQLLKSESQEKRNVASESRSADIRKQVDEAHKIIKRGTKEDLNFAEQLLSQARTQSATLDSALVMRIYWESMIARKQFSFHPSLKDPEKMRHVNKAMEHGIELAKLVSRDPDAGLQSQVKLERRILKGRRAELQCRQGIAEGIDESLMRHAVQGIVEALEELKIIDPVRFAKNAQVGPDWQKRLTES